MTSNALSTASVTDNIKRCSNEQLLSFFGDLRREDAEDLLFLFLETQEKAVTEQLNAPGDIMCPRVKKRLPLWHHLYSCFDTSSRATLSTQTSPLVTLPSSIGAYIISFGTMHDRLRCKRICRDFYKFCKMPIAKYHLVIDQNFVYAIKHDLITSSQFSHAQYLEVQYVFGRSNRTEELYGRLDEKQYIFIHRTLSKTASLHTIEYKLKYNHVACHLDKTSSWTHQGHLVEWLDAVDTRIYDAREHTYQRSGLFKSVRKLIWTPSDNQWGGSQNRARNSVLFDLLPNLNAIQIDRIKLYGADSPHFGFRDRHDDNDMEFAVMKLPFYRERLEHFEMNLNVAPKQTSRINDVRHIDIVNHPLSHFFKLSDLRSLTLTLPIFTGCHHYYGQLWTDEAMREKNEFKCMSMERISIEFVNSAVTNIRGPQNADLLIEPSVISRICRYILSFCPNVTHYSLRTNAYSESDYSDDHLMGYYDRLEYLETDTVSILPANARMLSLRSLRIRISECVQSQSDEVVEERLSDLDLSSYPKLESFKFIITNKLGVKFQNLEQNVLSFLNFVSESQSKGSAVNLKYIGMYHDTLYKNGKIKPQKSNCFEKARNDGKSLKICKTIISMTAAQSGRNVKSIELNPVRMASKDMDYLGFWFGGQFGQIEVEQYGNGRNDVNDVTVLVASE